MPTVPQYQRQVEPAAAPQLRATGDVPQGDVEAGFKASGELANQAFKLAQAEKQKADDTWSKDIYAKLLAKKNDLLHGENGALLKQGRDALAMVPAVEQEFGKYIEELESSAANDTQRELVRRFREREGLELKGTVQRHAGQEIERMKDRVHSATVEAQTNDAILNFNLKGKVPSSLRMIESTIRAYADEKGMPKEWTDAEITNAKSKVHTGIISRLIATGNAQGAMEWNAKYGQDITDKRDRVAVDKGIEVVGKQARIESLTSQILSEKTDEAAAIQEANARISDEDELKVVKKAIRDKFAEMGRINWRERSALLDSVYDNAASTGQMPDALTQSKMTGGELERLREYVDRKKSGKPFTTEQSTYYGLLDRAISADTQEAFLKEHLQEYRAKLSDDKYKELVELQRGLSQGDKKAQDKVWGLSSKAAMVGSLVKELKLGKENAEAFRASVDLEVERQEAALERKLTKDEIRKVFDALAISPDRPWRRDKPLGAYKISDVPDDFNAEFTTWFEKRNGYKPSGIDILNAYQRVQIKQGAK